MDLCEAIGGGGGGGGGVEFVTQEKMRNVLSLIFFRLSIINLILSKATSIIYLATVGWQGRISR